MRLSPLRCLTSATTTSPRFERCCGNEYFFRAAHSSEAVHAVSLSQAVVLDAPLFDVDPLLTAVLIRLRITCIAGVHKLGAELSDNTCFHVRFSDFVKFKPDRILIVFSRRTDLCEHISINVSFRDLGAAAIGW